METDAELLRRYVQEHDEAAFTELVNRHVNLVYAAASRETSGDAAAAEDITQLVFIELARKAARLTAHSALAGWLYTTVRHVSANHRRAVKRRIVREEKAFVMNDPLPPPGTTDAGFIPELDDALHELNDNDRTAVVLRFLEGNSLHEVGLALGLTENAARMRVERAVEKLRQLLTRRGITCTTPALTAMLVTGAVASVPPALAATVAAGALATAGVSTAATILPFMAMTKLKIGVISAVVIAGVATPFAFEHRANTRLGHNNEALRAQVDALSSENKRLSNLLAQANRVPSPPPQATEELLRLRAEVARLRNDAQELAQLKSQHNVTGNEEANAAARSWLSRLDQLKQRLEVTPEARIPEFQFLTEEDWLRAARGELNTEEDYRRAFSKLRSAAEGKAAPIYKKALDRFLRDNENRFPTDLAQLKPYFDPPLDDAVLQRWDVLPAKTVESLGMGGDWIITQRQAVDDVFDSRFGIGPNGWGSTDFSSRDSRKATAAVFDAYKNANNGQTPEDPSLLLPYATTPEQKSALERLITRSRAEKR